MKLLNYEARTEQNRTDLFRRKNIPLVSLYGKSNLIQHKVQDMATGKLRMDPAVIESSNHPVSVIYKKEFCFIYEFHISLFKCVCDHVRRKMETRAAPIT